MSNFRLIGHSLKQYHYLLVAGLLIIMLLLEINSVAGESQTIDEGVHLAAGYSYLVTGDYRMNQEHPPLMKELNALPLVFLGKKLDSPFAKLSWSKYDEWRFAKDLIYNNTIPADTLFLLGRLPTILLSLLLGWYVYRWTREQWGTGAALVALTFYTFAPNILAHSRYITTDLGVTTFFFITIYYFHKYLKTDSRRALLLTGLFFGLAQATKFSALVLVGVLPMLYCCYLFWQPARISLSQILKRFFVTFLAVFGLGAVIVWGSYAFQMQRPIEVKEISEFYTQPEYFISKISDEKSGGMLEEIMPRLDPETNSGKALQYVAKNIPLPAFLYFNGLGKLYMHNYYGHTAYLLGMYSEFGWWYYFPIAFAIKTPLVTEGLLFVLLLAGTVLLIRRISLRPLRLKKRLPLWLYCLTIPPLVYFGFSMTGHLNIGVRHILIVYPFIFVLIGWLTTQSPRREKKIITGLWILALTFYLYSSLSIYPHYLAYFNEAVGGPANGPKYLVDSNIDWGQDLKKLKRYMDKNEISSVCMSYFGQAEPGYYNIDFRYLPDSHHYQGIRHLNCLVAISITSLLSEDHAYQWLRQFEPDEKIGYSIYLYDFRYKD